MCRRKQTAEKANLVNVENFKFFVFVFLELVVLIFKKKSQTKCCYVGSTQTGWERGFCHGDGKSCIQMTNIHTLSSIKHIIISSVTKCCEMIYFFFFLFINILQTGESKEAKIKLFGINIFNMWHIQSSFAKVLGVHKTVFKLICEFLCFLLPLLL